MTTQPIRRPLDRVRATELGRDDGPTDGQLLARFVEERDEAVLACDLEGRTRKEAAHRLGIPDGTLTNRLAAARRMLARRLTRRGVTLGLAGLLSASVPARVSAALADTTARFAAGSPPSGARAVLNTLLVRRSANEGGKPNRLFLHVNPWVVKENFLKELAVFEEECDAVTHADVSADDRRIAIAGDDAVIRVYNRNDLRLLHKITLPKQTKLTAVRLSDDGGRLAAVGEAGFAKLFDAAGTEVCDLKGHEGTVAAVAFSPDGKRVATAVGKVAQAFDAANGERIAELAGHKNAVTSVAFSSDGKRIVTGSADKTAKVWELVGK